MDVKRYFPLVLIFAFGLWLVFPDFQEGLTYGYDDPAYIVRSSMRAKITLDIKNAAVNTPLLVKFSYFPRWKATTGDKKLKIHRVSPDFMLVFLEEAGNALIEFDFVWKQENYIGAIVSILTLGLCVTIIFSDRFQNLINL